MKNLIFILLIITVSCNSQVPKVQNVVINGQLLNSKNDTLYFSILHYDKISNTDTLVTDAQGRFNLDFKPKACNFYVLAHKGNNYVRLLIDKGERIQFKADIRNIPASYTIEGSKGSFLLKNIESKVARASLVVDSLTIIVNAKKNQPDFGQLFPALDSTYKTNFNNLKKELRQIINENKSSLASIVAVYQSLAGQSVFSQIDDFDVFNTISDSVYKQYPENSFAISLRNNVNDLKQRENERKKIQQTLQVGKAAPDIKIIDRNGKSVQLSSLKGKVVLLKFWDSHCQKCKNENLKLMSIYSKYKSKGFEIFAVSVDTDKKEWLAYLNKNNFNWLHSWLYDEPKNAVHPIASTYYIDQIPVGHLIGKDGKFLATEIKCDDIEAELEKILK